MVMISVIVCEIWQSLQKSYFVWLPWQRVWSEKICMSKKYNLDKKLSFDDTLKRIWKHWFFQKIWKANLEWCTSALGMEYPKLQSWNVQFGSKLGILSRVTLNFDGLPSKTTGHLFYAMLSFVHHFKVIGEFKLKLQSRNSQFGSKSSFFCPMWPWNLTDDLVKQ